MDNPNPDVDAHACMVCSRVVSEYDWWRQSPRYIGHRAGCIVECVLCWRCEHSVHVEECVLGEA